jgi:hypothetical protein
MPTFRRPQKAIVPNSADYFKKQHDWRRRPKEKVLQGKKIYYLFDYYPHGHTPINNYLKTANQHIRALKSDSSSIRNEAEKWFATVLSERAPIDNEWIWSYVPSSDPRSRFTGVRDLAQRMSAKNITSPMPKILERKKSIRTKEYNTDGSFETKIYKTVKEHESTLGLADNRSLAGLKIILLDDVVTSGSSIIACRNILLKANVKDVMMLGLGLTLKNR